MFAAVGHFGKFWSCELVFWCYRWFWWQNRLFSSQMGSNVTGSCVEVAQKSQWTPMICEENVFHFVEQHSFVSYYPTGGQIELRIGVYLMFYSKMWITYNTNSVSLKHQLQTPINWCSAWWAAETKKNLCRQWSSPYKHLHPCCFLLFFFYFLLFFHRPRCTNKMKVWRFWYVLVGSSWVW